MNVRNATKNDAQTLLDIYAPYITDTCITFETVVPSAAEFCRRIDTSSAQYPYIVCEDNGVVIGYAYASEYGERAAYRYSANVSVYVDKNRLGAGAGSLLYSELLSCMRERGIYAAYSGICVPNERSVALHEKFGFKRIAVFEKIGYKQDKWLDLLWMCRELKAREGAPEPY